MKNCNAFFFILWNTSVLGSLYAQTTVALSGQFYNKEQLPMEYIEVLVMQNDSLLTTDLTDAKGTFYFDLPLYFF